MGNFAAKLGDIADHPWANLAVGLIMLFFGLTEAWSTILVDIRTGTFGAHHAVILLGLANAFKAFSHLHKGTR